MSKVWPTIFHGSSTDVAIGFRNRNWRTQRAVSGLKLEAQKTPEREHAGLAALYAQHRAEILRFLRARTRDPVEAEDVIQELWIRLQEARPGPLGNGRAYLYQMA